MCGHEVHAAGHRGRGAAALLSGHQLPQSLKPDMFLVLEGGGLRTSVGIAPVGEGAPRNVPLEDLSFETAIVEEQV